MPTSGPYRQSAACRLNHKCLAPCRARLAKSPRIEFPEPRALLHRRTRKSFPCESARHSSAAQREVNHARSGKKYFRRRRKRTVWTIVENLVADRGDSYAAEAAARLLWTGASSPSQRTLTSFETPGSCIVTPYNTLPVSIVLRLCVTMMNCVWLLISPTSRVNRPTFASSSGASTSSKIQNGLG